MALTPEQRHLRARHAALVRWSKADAAEAAHAQGVLGQDGLLRKFAEEIDPDHVLSEAERYRLAVRRRTAHMAALSYQRSRKAKASDDGGDVA